MLKICGAAITAVILSLVLKRRESSLSPFIGEIAAITITFNIISSLSPLITFIKSSAQGIDSNSVIPTVLTACSVAVICQTVCNICKSNGENSLAYAVELAGNAEIILLSLPYLKSILSQIFGELGL